MKAKYIDLVKLRERKTLITVMNYQKLFVCLMIWFKFVVKVWYEINESLNVKIKIIINNTRSYYN